MQGSYTEEAPDNQQLSGSTTELVAQFNILKFILINEPSSFPSKTVMKNNYIQQEPHPLNQNTACLKIK